MNWQQISYSLSSLLILTGIAMLWPWGWSLYYGEADSSALLGAALITLFVGLSWRKSTKPIGELYNKETFCLVTFAWLLVSLVGTLPYLFTGTFTTFADAFFESLSGFTATGATVLNDLEVLSHGVLFWRSLTHWLGGLGIIVLFLILVPSANLGGVRIWQTETPGGNMTAKFRPRVRETAKMLWLIYLLMTIAETVFLWIGGLSFFDALCHSFGTIATAGFSTKNASIGAYNSVIQWIIIIFMFLAGTNFVLYYQFFLTRRISVFTRNSEFKLYLFLVGIATSVIFIGSYSQVGLTFREVVFQVVSLLTTTGYSTADFALWPSFGQVILVVLMFMGGCVGSTSGGLKIRRVLILLKQVQLGLKQTLHPQAILDLKIDGESISPKVVVNVLRFFFLYCLLIFLGTMSLTLEGLDLVTAFTAAVASLGNIGPGLAGVGPSQNYGFLSAGGKFLLSFMMLLGRLELYAVLVLLQPSFWRRG